MTVEGPVAWQGWVANFTHQLPTHDHQMGGQHCTTYRTGPQGGLIERVASDCNWYLVVKVAISFAWMVALELVVWVAHLGMV